MVAFHNWALLYLYIASYWRWVVLLIARDELFVAVGRLLLVISSQS
jgi:hypothetical protein